MGTKGKFFGLTLSAATFLAMAGCGAAPASSSQGNAIGSEFLLGMNLELSGGVAAYGLAEKNGAELAIEEINAEGGIDGKKIKVVAKDNKSETPESASVASNLTVNSKVVAVVGPATSGAVKAATPNMSKAAVPMVTPSGTEDSLTYSNGKVQADVFRSCFQDSYQGVAIAKYAEDELGAKTAAVFSDNSSDYGVGLTKAFKETFKGDIVAEETYTSGDKDFNAQLTSIKSKDFDVLVIPGYYNEAGLIVKQAREMGIEVAILGPDGFGDQAFIDTAGAKNATDIYYTAHFSAAADDNSKVQDFMAAYQDKYGETPSQFAALAYDAVYMIKEAAEDVGAKNSVDVAKGLSELKDFEGVTGKMSMDDKHNPEKSVTVIGLTDGKESSVDVVD